MASFSKARRSWDEDNGKSVLSPSGLVWILWTIPRVSSVIPGAPGIFLWLVWNRFDLWSSGRLYLGRRMCRFGENDPKEVLALMQEYGISARLTFSNSLLKEKHLSDRKCNALCALLEENKDVQNGVIVHSDLLLEYLKKHYPHLYFVSSTTKVITDFKQLVEEIRREDFRYVVQICMNMPEDSTDYYYLANKKVLGNCRWEGCERYV